MKQDLLFTYQDVPMSHATPASIASYTEQLRAIAGAKTGPYVSPEHTLRLPLDPGILADVTETLKRYWNTQLRYVVVVGIGGSNLAAKAVYDALRGTMDGLSDGYPKLIFADTVSARLLVDIERILETDVSYPEEFIVNLISKSGSTTESIANFTVLHDYLARRFDNAASRIVVTTDHGSRLWQAAEKAKLGLLPIPKEVGGRFSAFSSVGLFPLALAGIDVEALLSGAKHFLEQNFTKENHALRMAEALYRAHAHGARMVNFFFFNPELESLGKWARQLYGESLGKERDRSGKTVHAGITPIVSIGSTDLHSMAQLYLGGPKDKFTLFVHVRDAAHVAVPTEGLFLDLVPGLAGKNPEEIMSAIYDGTKAAYGKHKLPLGEAILPALSPYALGMFMEWQMLAVMYLAELMHVNAFDQPNVEEYKRVTREILEAGK